MSKRGRPRIPKITAFEVEELRDKFNKTGNILYAVVASAHPSYFKPPVWALDAIRQYAKDYYSSSCNIAHLKVVNSQKFLEKDINAKVLNEAVRLYTSTKLTEREALKEAASKFSKSGPDDAARHYGRHRKADFVKRSYPDGTGEVIDQRFNMLTMFKRAESPEQKDFMEGLIGRIRAKLK